MINTCFYCFQHVTWYYSYPTLLLSFIFTFILHFLIIVFIIYLLFDCIFSQVGTPRTKK